MQHKDPHLVSTNANLEQMLANMKNVTMEDVSRVYFMVKKHRDPDLHFCYGAKPRNRIYTFYRGEYHEPSFKVSFNTRREAYEFIMRTYGTK